MWTKTSGKEKNKGIPHRSIQITSVENLEKAISVGLRKLFEISGENRTTPMTSTTIAMIFTDSASL